MLDKQVRLGRPIRMDGLAEATGGPAFATCAGLLGLAMREPPAAVRDFADSSDSGRISRFGRWLRTNF